MPRGEPSKIELRVRVATWLQRLPDNTVSVVIYDGGPGDPPLADVPFDRLARDHLAEQIADLLQAAADALQRPLSVRLISFIQPPRPTVAIKWDVAPPPPVPLPPPRKVKKRGKWVMVQDPAPPPPPPPPVPPPPPEEPLPAIRESMRFVVRVLPQLEQVDSSDPDATLVKVMTAHEVLLVREMVLMARDQNAYYRETQGQLIEALKNASKERDAYANLATLAIDQAEVAEKRAKENNRGEKLMDRLEGIAGDIFGKSLQAGVDHVKGAAIGPPKNTNGNGSA